MGVCIQSKTRFLSLELRCILWSLALVVNENVSFGVLVYAEADGLVFKVINLVEMSEHDVSDQEETTAAALKLVLVNGKLTLVAFSLMEVEAWLKLKHNLANLENYWLQVLCEVLTWLHHETEVVIINAVNFWNSFLPLCLQELERILWDANVVASSVNNGWHFFRLV